MGIKMSKEIPDEKWEQETLVQWLRLKKIFHWANVNENQGSFTNRKVAMIQEMKSRKAGKLKGVSDITVMLPNKILYLELKRRPKTLRSGKLSTSHTKTSPEQLDFIDKVNTYPYAVGKVCHGWEEGRDFILENMD